MNLTVLGVNWDEEPDAVSSPGLKSSPVFDSEGDGEAEIPFFSLGDLPDDDGNDSDYIFEAHTPVKRASPLTNIQKTQATLDFMRGFPRFSMHQFLETAFTTDDSHIKNFSGTFLAGDGPLKMMEIWWKACGVRNEELMDWVVQKAAVVCAREASFLTDRASEGPHGVDANELRVSARDVTVQMVNEFCIRDLTARYERVTPRLRAILKAVIAKDTKEIETGSRNPDAVSSVLLVHVCL